MFRRLGHRNYARAVMVVRCPELPENLPGGTVKTWHKQRGDLIVNDEPVLLLDTDKVVIEISAKNNGIMEEHCVGIDKDVKVGEPLYKISL